MEFDILKNLEWIRTHVWDALRNIGGVAIVTAICGFIVHKIDVHYEKRITNNYDQKLESLKMRLDTLSHIKNSQFDTQYAIYQELCSCFYSMISAIFWLFPTGLDIAPAAVSDEKQLYKDRFNIAQDEYNKTIRVLGAKAPFIDKAIFEKFEELQILSKKQLNSFLLSNPLIDDGTNPSITEISIKGFDRTEVIETKWKELLDILRTHISNLSKDNS